jgi:hypothetical protein
MPQDRKTCIICGRETPGPVICYRCFFNYDYRVYDTKASQPPPRLKHKAIAPAPPPGPETARVQDELAAQPHEKPLQYLRLPARPARGKPGGFWSRFNSS